MNPIPALSLSKRKEELVTIKSSKPVQDPYRQFRRTIPSAGILHRLLPVFSCLSLRASGSEVVKY